MALAIFQTIDLPSDPCALPSFNKPPVAKVEVCVCGIGVTSDLHHNTKHIFSESCVTHYPIIHCPRKPDLEFANDRRCDSMSKEYIGQTSV